MSEEQAHEAVARVHREEWARVVATLARRFRDLLRRLGRSDDAREAYDRAIALAGNAAEAAYLTRRRDEVAAAGE